MITSKQNPKIQKVRDLLAHTQARREAQSFVVEGVRLVEEAYKAGRQAQLVLFVEGMNERGRQVVEGFSQMGTPCEEISISLLNSISDTESPQGVLAVLPIQSIALPPFPDLLLILDGLRDPGNLGAVLRTSLAAGVQAVLMSPGTTDAFAPKVVRSAMGAHFYLPIHSLTWLEIQEYLKPQNSMHPIHLFLADSQEGVDYTQANFQQPVGLVIGSEAEGASEQARKLVEGRVHIPMPGQAESLNAAVAAGILMFEVVRQRRG
jgi:TrmH family RNA methyltransferase